MNLIDLHVHSTFSDGTFTPEELVAYALKKQLSAFALTDHDTFEGIPEVMSAAEKTPLEIIAGIEFSTDYLGIDVHIVGLDIDCHNPVFSTKVKEFRDSRLVRNLKMIDRLKEHGVDISIEQMQEKFGDAILTRGNFARYLLDCGYTASLEEAFEKYIGDHCPCFVPREKVTPMQAVELIYKTGGIPVLAHPILYRLGESGLCTLISSLKDAGLLGVEAMYSTHSQKDENLVRCLAKRYGLLISGGSDFHGSNKPHIDLGVGKGNLRIPYEILDELRERRKKS